MRRLGIKAGFIGVIGILLTFIVIIPALAAPNAGSYSALNDMLAHFHDKALGNITMLTNTAKRLFYYLVIIDLSLALILNFNNQDYLQLLVGKILKYGFIFWVIIDYKEIIGWVIKGFIWIGVTGGAGSTNLKVLNDPSGFANLGIQLVLSIIVNAIAASVTSQFLGLIYVGLGIIIFIAVVSIALNYFMTYLEFYVLGILCLALVPFGANRFTSWIGQKVLNVLFAFGVKLMVLSFLAAVTLPIIENYSVPALNIAITDPPSFVKSLLYMVVGSVALMLLAWHAPSLASSLLGGMPSLHAGSFFTPVVNSMNTYRTAGNMKSVVAQGVAAAATGGASAAVTGAAVAAQGVGTAAKGMEAVRAASSMTSAVSSSNVNSTSSSKGSSNSNPGGSQVAQGAKLLDRHGNPFS